MSPWRLLSGAWAVLVLLALGACGGGGGGSTAPTPVTVPPTPAATITAVGEGNLVIHPSADTRFTFALEAPIRIRETTGGSADWNFARFALFKGGREIERNELGSDVIRAGGFSPITANLDRLVRVFFRMNSDDFDRIDVILGFSDRRDGRSFTVGPVTGWVDVTISLTPALVPPTGTVLPGS